MYPQLDNLHSYTTFGKRLICRLHAWLVFYPLSLIDFDNKIKVCNLTYATGKGMEGYVDEKGPKRRVLRRLGPRWVFFFSSYTNQYFIAYKYISLYI